MAKKVIAVVKLQLPAGQANPSPPVGPALGQHGVNIMEFCKAFNAKTKGQEGMIIPAVITIYADRSFSFILKTPPASVLLKKAAGLRVVVKPGGWSAGKGLEKIPILKKRVNELSGEPGIRPLPCLPQAFIYQLEQIRFELLYALCAQGFHGVKLLKLRAVVDDKPLFNPRQLKFYQRAADYYQVPLGEALFALLPGGLQYRQFKVISLNRSEATPATARISPLLQELLSLLQSAGGSLTLKEIAAKISDPIPLSRLKSRLARWEKGGHDS
jgi:hypothetical protein